MTSFFGEEQLSVCISVSEASANVAILYGSHVVNFAVQSVFPVFQKFLMKGVKCMEKCQSNQYCIAIKNSEDYYHR